MEPSGTVVEASLVAAYEEEFADRVGGRRFTAFIAVNEQASALRLAVSALEVEHGDEVIVPSYAPAEAAASIRSAGASPVFADIDPRTFCLDPEAVAAAITPRTTAVMAVHQFGHPADLHALSSLCARHGLALLEDASQAQAASLDGRPVGSFGTVTAFPLGVVTADPALSRRIRRIRAGHELPTEASAAVGRSALDQLAGFTARRRANARVFDSALTGVHVPYVRPGAHHVYHRYTVRVPGNGRPDRDAFAKALAARGVKTVVPVPTPVHRLPVHRSDAHLPQTESAAAQTLSLPIDPLLTEREVERTVAACNALGGLLGSFG
ncbi:DegT/DnrJ/EryC1/StrS family aminotransferase [Streptomyces sp. RB6PN25]|uniref:DegT/DnrJ/EryC1/StrS family aminotransferase n=1 Tax=Streptomyces humicola TaxID=2953240 RepID=A0ABT1PZ05_9ACTN|nr:DegT/DnrJ/EryC1/StrS family aminotransferase [Streptomyces humicola]MCQ4082916.1 DegT/DnrJ/EryC1/StrS family aminotransferase [Streptomyces humicola]